MRHYLLFFVVFIIPNMSSAVEAEVQASRLVKECKLLMRAADPMNNEVLNRLSRVGLSATMQAIGKCLGIMRGFRDAIDINYYYNGDVTGFKSIACIPSSVTDKQMVKVFIKYADEHPEKLQLRDTNVITLSLVEAFPCPR